MILTPPKREVLYTSFQTHELESVHQNAEMDNGDQTHLNQPESSMNRYRVADIETPNSDKVPNKKLKGKVDEKPTKKDREKGNSLLTSSRSLKQDSCHVPDLSKSLMFDSFGLSCFGSLDL